MDTRTQLSQEQVDKLFDFVKSKFVRFEDLKYELVDHLASSIEDIQDKEPQKSFDEALKETYSRFPITGFTNFVAAKQKALSRYWMKKFFSYYIEFFKLPKIVLLIALAYSIYTVFQVVPHTYIMICLYVFAFLMFVKDVIHMKKVGKKSEKYMFMTAYYGQIFGVNFLLFNVLININFNGFWNITLGHKMTIVLSIIIALDILLNYAITKVFPKMLEEEINTKYAHLNIKLAL